MLLHLLRHGQSTWNVEGRLQGQTPYVPLTDLGREQARQTATQLAGARLDAIWTSDQVRAAETAAIIAEPHGLIPHQTPLLREQALGDMEGRLTRELEPQPVPDGQHISEVRWGGGESLADVADRLRTLLDALCSQLPHDAHVLLVSHGDTLRVLMALLDGRTHREVEWCQIANCVVIDREYRC